MTSHSPPRKSALADDSDMWSDVGAEWLTSSRDRVWRAYTDLLTSALIAEWIPSGCKTVLKTDLFDEAVSAGLYPEMQTLAETVHAIDVAETTVAAVQKKYPALQSRIADIRQLPYRDGMFDAVVSTSTLDHFEEEAEIHRSLREIRRVIGDGGTLLITLDNPLNPKLAMRAALPESLLLRTGLMPYHCGKTLARDDLRQGLTEAGFEIVREQPFLHCPRVMAVKLSALVARLSSPRAESSLLRGLRRFEALDRLPTRWRTGHFTAFQARARG